jgi:hypothetical protein
MSRRTELIYAQKTEKLKNLGPFDKIHDLGCGLGNFLELTTERLGERMLLAMTYLKGHAKKLLVNFRFTTFFLSILTAYFLQLANPYHSPKYCQDHAGSLFFMIRGIFWYVFPNLEIVIKTISVADARQRSPTGWSEFPAFSDVFHR